MTIFWLPFQWSRFFSRLVHTLVEVQRPQFGHQQKENFFFGIIKNNNLILVTISIAKIFLVDLSTP